jgi:hypothetical protein
VSRNTPEDDMSSPVVLRTTKDLRTSILEFGLNSNETRPSGRQTADNQAYHGLTTPNDVQTRDARKLVRQDTLALFKLQKENRVSDSFFDNLIRPGYSAKRYLSNWSKHWSPQLFEQLFREGKLCEETLYEPNEILPNIKHR